VTIQRSPQSWRLEVRLFSFLFLIGCVSVSTSGLGWDSFVEMFVNSFIDDLTYIGDIEVCMECVVWYKPGGICYSSEDFWLWSLYGCYAGFAGASPPFNSVCPNGFNHCFV